MSSASVFSISYHVLSDALFDALGTARFDSQVKIKVGPYIKLIGLLSNFMIFAYIGYTLSVTNFYLDEETPHGSVAHWSGNEEAMEVRGQEELNSLLCNYNASLDYVWESDSIWDYSAVSCDLQSVDKVAYKSGREMHFITHEQRRSLVTYPKVGSSCDEECQMVYPAWPSTASYGGRRWMSVHVDTALFNATRSRHPALPDVPNVKMHSPIDLGDKCRCISFENVYNLGVDKLTLEFSHEYTAVQAQMEGSSGKTGIHDPKSFFISSEKGVWKEFAKGEDRVFSIEEVLGVFGTCLDCDSEANLRSNTLCPNGACPEPYRLKPSRRTSGLVVDVETNYYSHKVNMPNGPGYDEIKRGGEPPYAVHVFRISQMWASRGSDPMVESKTSAGLFESNIYRYGVIVRLGKAGGKISRFDFYKVVGSLVQFVVLLSIPRFILKFVVFYCLPESAMLQAVQCKTFTMPELYRLLSHNVFLADAIYESYDLDGNGEISHSEFKKRLRLVFDKRLKESFPNNTNSEDGVDRLTEKIMHMYKGASEQVRLVSWEKSKDDPPEVITKEDVVDAALSLGLGDEVKEVIWNDMLVKLEDEIYEDPPWTQMLPKAIRRGLRKKNIQATNNRVIPCPDLHDSEG